ncbi:MAG: hypothetical protein AAFV49_10245 [Pseudomonadota bacterium]
MSDTVLQSGQWPRPKAEALREAVEHRPGGADTVLQRREIRLLADPRGRRRPKTTFDLALRIRELNYLVNALPVAERMELQTASGALFYFSGQPLSDHCTLDALGDVMRARLRRDLTRMDRCTRKRLSRLAKCDHVFALLTRAAAGGSAMCGSPGAGPAAGDERRGIEPAALPARADSLLLDRPGDRAFWSAGDGFVNVLTDPACLRLLSDPERFLLIPSAALAPLGRLRGVTAGPALRHGTAGHGPHPADRTPGFAAWFADRFPGLATAMSGCETAEPEL